MAVGGHGRLTGLSWARSIVAPHGGAAQYFGSHGDQSMSQRLTPPVERGLPLLRAPMTLTHDFAPAVPVVLNSESTEPWVEGAALRSMVLSRVPPSGWRGNVAHSEQVMADDAASSSPESRRQPVSVGLGLGSSPRRVRSAPERDPPPPGPRRTSTTGRQGNWCAHRASNTCPARIAHSLSLRPQPPSRARRLTGGRRGGRERRSSRR